MSMIKKNILFIILLVFVVGSIFLLGGSTILGVYKSLRGMFGPVFWLLLPMAAILLTSLGQMLAGRFLDKGLGSLADLALIETAGPSVGLLGTVIALQSGFSRLNLSTTDLDGAISGIINIIAVSLSTTVAGLVLGLLAWFLRTRVAPALKLRKVVVNQETPSLATEE